MEDNVAYRMAQMLAAAKPPQAQGQTLPRMYGGGGAAAPIQRNTSTNVSASVDAGQVQRAVVDIMNWFGKGPKAEAKEKQMIEELHNSYILQGASGDPDRLKQREEWVKHPIMQQLLSKWSGKSGSIVTKEEQAGIDTTPIPEDATPADIARIRAKDEASWGASRGGTREYYTFADFAAPEQSQREAYLQTTAGDQQREYELRKDVSPERLLSGMEGESERQKYLSGLMQQIWASKKKSGGEKGDPRILQLYKDWSAIYKQYAQDRELGQDDEAANYRANRTLAGEVLRQVRQFKKLTGSSDEAMGAVSALASNIDREYGRPKSKDKSQLERWRNYIKEFTAILKEGEVMDIHPYATLMDWMFKTGLSGKDVMTYFEQQFGASSAPRKVGVDKKGKAIMKSQLEEIYELTDYYNAHSDETPGEEPKPEEKWYNKVLNTTAKGLMSGYKKFGDFFADKNKQERERSAKEKPTTVTEYKKPKPVPDAGEWLKGRLEEEWDKFKSSLPGGGKKDVTIKKGERAKALYNQLKKMEENK
jgi:hypothetical protein